MCAEFMFLCNVLSSNSVLTLPKCDDNFVLQTDASGKGISAILSVYRDGQERPVAYYSKKLTPAERHYSATEVEGLAVVRGVQHFGHYLIRRHFRIETAPVPTVSTPPEWKALKVGFTTAVLRL